MTRFLHVNISLLTPGHFRGAWRLPDNDPRAFIDAANFRRLTRLAESAALHAVFVGDSPALAPDIANAPGLGHDPVVMLADAAAGTSHIGVIATASTTFEHPYALARKFLSLDHLTGGRAGWNAVTTQAVAAAANFGLPELPDKELRYRRAEEFASVVTGLWDGWEPEALLGDKSGHFADTSRIHKVAHQGEFFSVAGPLPLPRSPQGRPLVVQAGGSPGGQRLAGRHADLVFTTAQTPELAKAQRETIRSHATGFGRDPESVQLSTGLVVVIGGTEEEARRRETELRNTIPSRPALDQLAGQLGLAPGSLEADTVLTPDSLSGANGRSAGFGAGVLALLRQRPHTALELVHRFAGGAGHRLVVGTPEQVADGIVDWFAADVTDGFTIMPGDTNHDFAAFVEQVVPILVRRGVFRGEYIHDTLRGNLGLTLEPAGVLR
ncbi:NtaA/DmoA family FMN-dependent monooxygenase [Nocardia higoensis]|uniref:NtaA/DmoA family FMN-dependent monooxygenase n=1 Tax=Nocardia higoensis TaxID=228599 RepID=UPI0005927EF3|nr:NtaA/DmoA family FMN-dependent monooxygenase [Nocardia higoensis]